MVEVVPGEQLDDAVHALRPALRVQPGARALVGRQAAEPAECGAARGGVVFERLGDGALVVVEARRPGVLVVPG